MSSDVKSDIQRSGEQAERLAFKSGKEATKGLKRLVHIFRLYWGKHFKDPIYMVKKHGRTEDLCYSDRLTEPEAKELLSKLHQAKILTCFKEVNQNKNELSAYNGKTISQQEKFARTNILARKWSERADRFEDTPLLNKICLAQKERYENRIEQEKGFDSGKRYIFFVNKDHQDSMGRFIEEIRNERLVRRTQEDEVILPEQEEQQEKILDEKVKEYTHDMEIKSLDELNDPNYDYGPNECSSYIMKNVCTHVIPKEVFKDHYKELWENCIFGAKVRNDNEMLLIYTPSQQIGIQESLGEDYDKYKEGIIEYGGTGSPSLHLSANNDDVMTVTMNEEDLYRFKELYQEEAYLVEHNPDGLYTVISTKSAQKKAMERAEQLKKEEASQDLLQKEDQKELETDFRQTDKKEDIISPALAEKDMTVDAGALDNITLDDFDMEKEL